MLNKKVNIIKAMNIHALSSSLNFLKRHTIMYVNNYNTMLLGL